MNLVNSQQRILKIKDHYEAFDSDEKCGETYEKCVDELVE